MVALAADHRSMHLRRWMISAAIVVLAHAGIASAVLTWRSLSGRLGSEAPIEIRLTPEPVTTPPMATIPQAAPGQPATKPAEAPTTAKREQTVVSPPSEQVPRATSPVIVTPEDRAQREHDSLYANQGPARGSHANPLSGPIDTTLGNPNLRPNISAANDWRKALLTHRRPLGSSAQSRPRGPRVANGTEVRNAIGVLEPRTGTPDVSPLLMPAPGSGVAGAIGHTVTNGLGTMVESPNRLSPRISPFAQTAPGGGLNGTELTRPGSGMGSVGGAAKTGTTGLNGSSFRPK